jgi:hypothetical protein
MAPFLDGKRLRSRRKREAIYDDRDVIKSYYNMCMF